ncbi:hypothetical protein CFK38_15015 [Brachybacterium vulturis]|uniref:Uncharacterized protein n=1 Tax=Brachybacterium vulturis TaxID=2017484 RepID=A0A291GRE9_9MICO|nr:hypothetical protein [Brachybacterium vulturis]ATG52690.1 hypothetical protein CFK38_15015 [Brachybacterium vulturis]
MSTVKDPENAENPGNLENGEFGERPEGHQSNGHAEIPEPPEYAGDSEQPRVDAQGESEVTSLYVRRSRTPTLGFWVTLALIAPAVVALLGSFFLPFTDISSVLNFMLVAVVFVGLPLAAIAALVDAIRHRRGPKRRR